MKNMGLHDLWLVNPREFPHPEATARASGADDVLASARVVASLPEAIADCGLVLGTTARTREQYFRVLEARAAGERIVAEAHKGPVAVLFRHRALRAFQRTPAHRACIAAHSRQSGLRVAEHRHGGAAHRL